MAEKNKIQKKVKQDAIVYVVNIATTIGQNINQMKLPLI